MGHDGQVPQTPRAALPPTGPAARPQDVPRVAEISALLGEIDALRTTLSTDLSLAAAALEEGADQLAGELVGGDIAAVRGFEARALGHLHALDSVADSTADSSPDTAAAQDEPVRVARPLRRRLLPAAPVLAAAAALIGVVAGVVPRSPAPQAPVMSSAAAASWELNRLADEGASAAELRAVAEVLNDRLAALVAAAASDPAAAQQALLLLRDTAQVLREADDQRALAGVLQEARTLAARLAAVLPRTSPTGGPPPATAEIAALLASPAPRPASQPTRESAPQPAPASPKPAASTAPSPKPAPQPSPSPTPTPQPSASPTPAGDPILVRPGDLPGF